MGTNANLCKISFRTSSNSKKLHNFCTNKPRETFYMSKCLKIIKLFVSRTHSSVGNVTSIRTNLFSKSCEKRASKGAKWEK